MIRKSSLVRHSLLATDQAARQLERGSIRVGTHAMSDAGSGQHSLEPKQEEEFNEPIPVGSPADVAPSKATPESGG